MSSLSLSSFEEKVLHLPDDYEGKVIATLVISPLNTNDRPAVLYLHGFNDYFFQSHVAEAFDRHGYDFYALDLRKYGRSLLPHQHPNYCRSISEYFEEIDMAIKTVRLKNKHSLSIMGHSTGGLIAASYLNKGNNRNEISNLLLNSPFLQFNLSRWRRMILLPLAGILAKIAPYSSKNKPFSRLYGASIYHEEKGEWTYNEEWKPIEGYPAFYSWIHAMHRAQKWLRRNSHIQVPILILHSDSSGNFLEWDDRILKTDMVLNVKHIQKYGKLLGPNVQFAKIDNSMHDVFLSTDEVRRSAYSSLFSWLSSLD